MEKMCTFANYLHAFTKHEAGGACLCAGLENVQ